MDYLEIKSRIGDFPTYRRSPRLILEPPTEKIEIRKPAGKAGIGKSSLVQIIVTPLVSDKDKDEMVLNVKAALRVKDGDETLNVAELKLYEDVRDEIKASVLGPQHNSPSDVYGGLSNNVLKGGYGHPDDYYDGAWDVTNNDYYNPVKEVWAQWFSYKMTGNEQMIAMEEEYFPATTELMEEFAEYEFGEN